LKSREKILQLLKAHPVYSAKKLADAIGITEKGVEKQLAFQVHHLRRVKGPGAVSWKS
jgi:predicted ArsR family transcriptional regulator